MKKYEVIEFFHDLKDKNHAYKKGDTFPREGCTYPVSTERLAELSGSGNKRGIPLIAAVEEPAAVEPAVEQPAVKEIKEKTPEKKPAAKKGK